MDKILIGILCIDRPCTTKKCLELLFSKTDRKRYTLCVIDNNSNDLTKEVLWDKRKDIDICITNPHNIGTAFGVNEYLQHRKLGQHALNVNVDAHILVDDWLNTMLEIIKIGDVGTVSGRRPTFWYDDPYRLELMRSNLSITKLGEIFIEWPMTNEIIFPWTLMKGEVLDALGFMNESTCIDDFDFIRRVTALQLKNVYVPDVVILQPQDEEQKHPEYEANRKLIQQNMPKNHKDLADYKCGINLYKGTRFIPLTITDTEYKEASDTNWRFFADYASNSKI